jgi:hypothetical protein
VLHTHKTLMEELGTPRKLMDERVGHQDGSVQARYSHITAAMRRHLLDGLTGLWEAALNARRPIGPGSPVDVLDRLLRAEDRDGIQDRPRISPSRGWEKQRRPARLTGIWPLTCWFAGGRYWDRTSDLFGVNADAAAG